MQSVKADLFLRAEAELAEGPLWIDGALWFVDILGAYVARVKVDGEGRPTATERFPVGDMVGALAPRRRGGLVLALKDRFAFLDPRSGEITTLARPADLGKNVRFNDGKCDPRGRFLAGTMGLKGEPCLGKLYSLSDDHSVRELLDAISVSNGLAWCRDGHTFYYIDTPTRRVRAFDYDVETGSLSNGRDLVAIPGRLGSPDGMTVDQDGNLWIAQWGGAGVGCWGHSTGELIEWVEVPARNVTSCTFGGPGLDRLFITTAKSRKTAETSTEEDEGGSIFVCRPGVRGYGPASYAG